MLVSAGVALHLLVLCPSLVLDGKDKKPILPAYVLNAQTVLVLIDPAAGTPVNAPLANKTAQDDVEKALEKIGPFEAGAGWLYGRSGDHGTQGVGEGCCTADDWWVADQRSSRDCTADRFRHSARRTEGTATGNARFHPEHAWSAGGNGAARGRFRGVRGARLDTRAFPSAALRQ